MNIVFIGLPKAGGGYSHFRYLKDNLKKYNFFLLSLGETNIVQDYEDDAYVSIGTNLSLEHHKQELAKLFIEYVEDNNIDIIIPNNSPIVVSCLPLLPPNVKVVYVVNSDTPRVYKYVTEHLEYISAIVCISIAQTRVLSRKLSDAQNKIKLIPHGVDVQSPSSINVANRKLQIGFLGRLHDGHKRIFIIPEILKKNSEAYDLHIIGDGPDKEEFISRLNEYNISYVHYGFINYKDLQPIISFWDIMLFPSVVEGFGLTLIETMQYGVVPIANRLEGITDYIIEDGRSGFLVDNNDVNSYVDILNILSANRKILTKTKEEAHLRVKNNFNLEKVCQAYDRVFQEAILFQKPEKKDFKDWKPYKEYKPNVVHRATNKIKLFLKSLH